jgi:hypothetical protein
MKTKVVDFTPPSELTSQIGEAVEPGQRLELMATFAVKPNGDWCIASVEGVPFPGYDADGNPTDKPEEPMNPRSQFAEKYHEANGTEY